ncbi:MAG: hypothetical protein A3C85_00730 [Candidatus Doudnabacteria bacterium RIFCSPHIGHO2_02_FULL_48_21]|nr:MAG: hypothetical protein A3K05_04720 [Candidatus Doudnabacteria bacterium RIFCSPHIGHO2_01_48_18]OGE77288.1 MAG: hypothetical protein A2668_02570 [Candidatus Doudnabacteria bacterium RIFCSPHIGHO2_01_FULL_48_180]OGE91031.1 MAG: hypothetical protein A3F44_01760 [Candidatus Doudnabacteria bacterium RIFCSPHIGHO2_12_FULL_47_25]OGE92828.1 MAG: hypothetical protein A3C85_00730 [Candidatus Doudnabacteria bacterium RIFCSPHIGHO2_02_FULL_48_21]OGE96859.1 MAG: hypothetical protein A3A83_03965 [Candidatu
MALAGAGIIVGVAFVMYQDAQRPSVSDRNLSTDLANAGKVPTDGGDWKLYRNERYRVEMMIPADWIVTTTQWPELINFEDPNRTYYLVGLTEGPPAYVQFFENTRSWDPDDFLTSDFHLPYSLANTARRARTIVGDRKLFVVEGAESTVYEVVLQEVIVRVSALKRKQLNGVAEQIASTVQEVID